MSDATGLEAFRQQWWGDRQPLGFPSFLNGQNSPDGQAAPAQGDQWGQMAQANANALAQARATMRTRQMQTASPDAAQALQSMWAAQDQGGQAQTPQAMMQAMQARMRAQQMQTADPDVAQNLQNAWAAQDRAGG